MLHFEVLLGLGSCLPYLQPVQGNNSVGIYGTLLALSLLSVTSEISYFVMPFPPILFFMLHLKFALFLLIGTYIYWMGKRTIPAW